jgi:hypothetical protein
MRYSTLFIQETKNRKALGFFMPVHLFVVNVTVMIKKKMKKSTASFICFIMMFSLFLSCEENDNSFDSAPDLRAPNGELIADNMSSFKEEVSFVIEDIYGERKEFEIVKLEFVLDIPQGYLG